ncbi:MAG: tetratricopeptide repeat protein [Hyphomicrobiaceae bacterium]
MKLDFLVSQVATGRVRGMIGVSIAALLACACSAGNALNGAGDAQMLATASSGKADAPQKSELEKAIEYWGGEFKKHPHSLKAALSYARNLKAAGRKRDAFSVVQSAALLHGDDRELISEYGRLALDMGQVQVALKVLAMADDPAKPDWRVVSARGTALAKQGKYAEALPFYERALQLSPGEPSVLNNLALVYAASGEPAKGETILREVADKSDDPKIRQNLALVLGLQGKYSEAETQSAKVLPPAAATANADYLRQFVKAPAVEPKVSFAEATVRRAPQTSVVVAKAPAEGANVLRPSSGPNAVSAPASGWSGVIAQH